jgi:hypothetical protein
MLVVGRHEHCQRHFLWSNGIHHSQAIQLGHLDIQKDQVRALALNHCNGSKTVTGLEHGGDVPILPQQVYQALARGRLVINDEYTDVLKRSVNHRSLPSTAKGKYIATAVPPSRSVRVFGRGQLRR